MFCTFQADSFLNQWNSYLGTNYLQTRNAIVMREYCVYMHLVSWRCWCFVTARIFAAHASCLWPFPLLFQRQCVSTSPKVLLRVLLLIAELSDILALCDLLNSKGWSALFWFRCFIASSALGLSPGADSLQGPLAPCFKAGLAMLPIRGRWGVGWGFFRGLPGFIIWSRCSCQCPE